MERGHQYEHYGTTDIVEKQKHAELKGSTLDAPILTPEPTFLALEAKSLPQP